MSRDFFLGVIEGFYGRQWPWEERAAAIDFLHANGYRYYIYAPKGDDRLRHHWRKPWTDQQFAQLEQLAGQCHEKGLGFGIGLSPVELDWPCNVDDRQALDNKLAAIRKLQPGLFCILFDDIRGDHASLAERQLAIVQYAIERVPGCRYAICPTYYSFDPILEKLFGAMPANYLEQLGEGLPADVDIFWTGNRVCSEGYTRGDFERVSALIGRKPLLWDNYPVNDGERISRYLHLKPFNQRPREMSQWLQGHVVNPMNQPQLSRLPLCSLDPLYRTDDYDPESFFPKAVDRVVADDTLRALLKRDYCRFQEEGLDQLAGSERRELIASYAAIDHPMAREVVDWLEEGYRFDPACLTG